MNRDEFGRECARRRDAGLVISGDTYMVRGQIKADGGIWDARLRAWLLPDMGAWCRVSALVASQASRGSQGAATVAASAASTQRVIPAPAASSRVTQTPQGRRNARPCGYPGCNPPAYCDECEGEGALEGYRRAF